jgi:hypothetical protein
MPVSNGTTKSSAANGAHNGTSDPSFEARSPDGTGEHFSTYEDYDSTSNHYDMARVPVAIETLYGGLLSGADNAGQSLLSQSRVLEMGCGTGSYTVLVARCVK